MATTDFLGQRLQRARQSATYRRLPRTVTGTDFWSNDYLGLSRLRKQPVPIFSAPPGSRLISGDHGAIHEIEQRIADFHGFPSALLFGSGYLANLGLLSCLGRRTDTFIYDELIHASLRDGLRLSGAAARRCQHNRTQEVNRQIQQARSDGQQFVLTEGRFSMDGDTAPLSELAELCTETDAHLIVDEAHSVGIDGPNGAGLVASGKLQSSVFATIITYGKAPGYHGAAVLGSCDLRDYLINFSRPLIYTTAPSAEYVAGLGQTYDLLGKFQAEQHQKLQSVIDAFTGAVANFGLNNYCSPQPGPIQTIRFGDSARVMTTESKLRGVGILVKGIRAPTVAAGTERLRICLHAFNTEEEVDTLFRHLNKQLR